MAYPKLDKAIEAKIVRLLAKGLSHREIASKVGCGLGTVSNVRKVWYPDGVEPPEPPADPLTKQKEQIDRARAMKLEREQLNAVAGEKSFREFLANLVRETVEPWPVPKPIKVPTSRGTAGETIVCQWSDWHAYEDVKPEAVLNLNEYNAEVFGKRARRIVETSLSIADRMRRGGGWKFDNAILALNGDFISGTIHEVEKHTDAPNVVLAAYGTGHVLAAAIRDFARPFKSVRAICTSGNHGRLPDARKVQLKDPMRSWDTLVYLFAQTALANDKRITFQIPPAWNLTYDVYSHKFYQGHGHFIRSWMHLPVYGIKRMATSLQSVYAPHDGPINYFLLGHFHEPSQLSMAGGEAFVNGCLIGPTELSVHHLGQAGAPQQWMLMVHPEHGVTGRWPILANGGTTGYEVRPWQRFA